MHILIIPSEEYVPTDKPGQGVFQRHQVNALKKANYKLGVLSVKLEFSLTMLIKALIYKIFRRRITNKLENKKFGEILKEAIKKLTFSNSLIKIESIDEVPLVRVEGMWFLPRTQKNEILPWTKYGLHAYKSYVKRFGKPDIIHSHNAINAGFLAVKLYKKYRIPYFLTEHSSFYARDLVPESVFPNVKEVYETTRRLIVVSPKLGDYLKGKFKLKKDYEFIPNVLEERFCYKNTIRTDIKNDEFIFLNVATFIELKGQQEIN
jgi:hypothetical protein